MLFLLNPDETLGACGPAIVMSHRGWYLVIIFIRLYRCAWRLSVCPSICLSRMHVEADLTASPCSVIWCSLCQITLASCCYGCWLLFRFCWWGKVVLGRRVCGLLFLQTTSQEIHADWGPQVGVHLHWFSFSLCEAELLHLTKFQNGCGQMHNKLWIKLVLSVVNSQPFNELLVDRPWEL